MKCLTGKEQELLKLYYQIKYTYVLLADHEYALRMSVCCLKEMIETIIKEDQP